MRPHTEKDKRPIVIGWGMDHLSHDHILAGFSRVFPGSARDLKSLYIRTTGRHFLAPVSTYDPHTRTAHLADMRDAGTDLVRLIVYHLDWHGNRRLRPLRHERPGWWSGDELSPIYKIVEAMRCELMSHSCWLRTCGREVAGRLGPAVTGRLYADGPAPLTQVVPWVLADCGIEADADAVCRAVITTQIKAGVSYKTFCLNLHHAGVLAASAEDTQVAMRRLFELRTLLPEPGSQPNESTPVCALSHLYHRVHRHVLAPHHVLAAWMAGWAHLEGVGVGTSLTAVPSAVLRDSSLGRRAAQALQWR